MATLPAISLPLPTALTPISYHTGSITNITSPGGTVTVTGLPADDVTADAENARKYPCENCPPFEEECKSATEAAPNVLKEACTFTPNLIPTTAASPAFPPPSIGTEGCTSALPGTVPTAVPPVLMAAVPISILASRSHSPGNNKGKGPFKEVPAVARTKKYHCNVPPRLPNYKLVAPGPMGGSPVAVPATPPIPGCSPSLLPNEGLPITNTSLPLGTLPVELDKTGYCVEEPSTLTFET